MHGPFIYIQSIYFLAYIIKPDHLSCIYTYPSVQCFDVKHPTRSDPCLNCVAKLDEIDVYEY